MFFGIIQFFYAAYVSFAVQKAAFSIAQEASAASSLVGFDPHFQIVCALLPLEKLNPSTLTYALASKCTVRQQGSDVHATVSYPMPIWVPFMGALLGQSLASNITPIPSTITNLLQTIGISLSGISSISNSAKVIWINFDAQVLDESTVGQS
jgi:hypothetical protein